jgi:hypothetical protein
MVDETVEHEPLENLAEKILGTPTRPKSGRSKPQN